jgi:hypothetical protein
MELQKDLIFDILEQSKEQTILYAEKVFNTPLVDKETCSLMLSILTMFELQAQVNILDHLNKVKI